ncbi:hypothetical protein F4805DRAFT_444750 [Annulohypoxylon moriforme]|nr:hypothetical protein F4805DRAFT_444750 [Annulohypoxylon moriforme]
MQPISSYASKLIHLCLGFTTCAAQIIMMDIVIRRFLSGCKVDNLTTNLGTLLLVGRFAARGNANYAVSISSVIWRRVR